MNTDPFHQLKTALQTAGALTDQSLKEIERLSIQNEELRAERNKFKNALYGHVEYPSTGAAWERAAEYQVERDQLKQQLAQAQAAQPERPDIEPELKHAGWLPPDEAKRLEADAAAMREALENSNREIILSEEGRKVIAQNDKALSTTAGRSLLERLERYEKALKEITAMEAAFGDESGVSICCRKAREALKDTL